MNEEAILDAHTQYSASTGYKGSLDEFKKLISEDEGKFKEVYGVFREGGYDDDEESFAELVGVKKKEATIPQETTGIEEPQNTSTNTQEQLNSLRQPSSSQPTQDGLQPDTSSREPEETTRRKIASYGPRGKILYEDVKPKDEKENPGQKALGASVETPKQTPETSTTPVAPVQAQKPTTPTAPVDKKTRKKQRSAAVLGKHESQITSSDEQKAAVIEPLIIEENYEDIVELESLMTEHLKGETYGVGLIPPVDVAPEPIENEIEYGTDEFKQAGGAKSTVFGMSSDDFNTLDGATKAQFIRERQLKEYGAEWIQNASKAEVNKALEFYNLDSYEGRIEDKKVFLENYLMRTNQVLQKGSSYIISKAWDAEFYADEATKFYEKAMVAMQNGNQEAAIENFKKYDEAYNKHVQAVKDAEKASEILEPLSQRQSEAATVLDKRLKKYPYDVQKRDLPVMAKNSWMNETVFRNGYAAIDGSVIGGVINALLGRVRAQVNGEQYTPVDYRYDVNQSLAEEVVRTVISIGIDASIFTGIGGITRPVLTRIAMKVPGFSSRYMTVENAVQNFMKAGMGRKEAMKLVAQTMPIEIAALRKMATSNIVDATVTGTEFAGYKLIADLTNIATGKMEPIDLVSAEYAWELFKEFFKGAMIGPGALLGRGIYKEMFGKSDKAIAEIGEGLFSFSSEAYAFALGTSVFEGRLPTFDEYMHSLAILGGLKGKGYLKAGAIKWAQKLFDYTVEQYEAKYKTGSNAEKKEAISAIHNAIVEGLDVINKEQEKQEEQEREFVPPGKKRVIHSYGPNGKIIYKLVDIEPATEGEKTEKKKAEDENKPEYVEFTDNKGNVKNIDVNKATLVEGEVREMTHGKTIDYELRSEENELLATVNVLKLNERYTENTPEAKNIVSIRFSHVEGKGEDPFGKTPKKIEKQLDAVAKKLAEKHPELKLEDEMISVNMGKGIGSLAYVKLAEFMHENYGWTVVSDTTRSEAAENLWKGLEAKGLARKRAKEAVIDAHGGIDNVPKESYIWEYTGKQLFGQQRTATKLRELAEAVRAKAGNKPFKPEITLGGLSPENFQAAYSHMLKLTAATLDGSASVIDAIDKAYKHFQKTELYKKYRDEFNTNKDLFISYLKSRVSDVWAEDIVERERFLLELAKDKKGTWNGKEYTLSELQKASNEKHINGYLQKQNEQLNKDKRKLEKIKEDFESAKARVRRNNIAKSLQEQFGYNYEVAQSSATVIERIVSNAAKGSDIPVDKLYKMLTIQKGLAGLVAGTEGNVRFQNGVIKIDEKEAIKFKKLGVVASRDMAALKLIGIEGLGTPKKYKVERLENDEDGLFIERNGKKEGMRAEDAENRGLMFDATGEYLIDVSAVQKKFKEYFNELLDTAFTKNKIEDNDSLDRYIDNEINIAIRQGQPAAAINRLKSAKNSAAARQQIIKDIERRNNEEIKRWTDYLKESDYEDSFKILILDAVLTTNYDAATNKYIKRSGTTYNRGITVFDAGALAGIYLTGSKELLKDYVNLQAENATNIQDTHAVEKTKEGAWIKFNALDKVPEADRDAHVAKLSALVQGTPWCTKTAARTHLEGGDFYVFTTTDAEGKTYPRAAVRTNNGRVQEVRGVLPSQNLEPIITPVVRDFLTNSKDVSDGEAWLKATEVQEHQLEIYDKLVAAKEKDPNHSISLEEYNHYTETAEEQAFGYGESQLGKDIKRLAEEAINNNPEVVLYDASLDLETNLKGFNSLGIGNAIIEKYRGKKVLLIKNSRRSTGFSEFLGYLKEADSGTSLDFEHIITGNKSDPATFNVTTEHLAVMESYMPKLKTLTANVVFNEYSVPDGVIANAPKELKIPVKKIIGSVRISLNNSALGWHDPTAERLDAAKRKNVVAVKEVEEITGEVLIASNWYNATFPDLKIAGKITDRDYLADALPMGTQFPKLETLHGVYLFPHESQRDNVSDKIFYLPQLKEFSTDKNDISAMMFSYVLSAPKLKTINIPERYSIGISYETLESLESLHGGVEVAIPKSSYINRELSFPNLIGGPKATIELVPAKDSQGKDITFDSDSAFFNVNAPKLKEFSYFKRLGLLHVNTFVYAPNLESIGRFNILSVIPYGEGLKKLNREALYEAVLKEEILLTDTTKYLNRIRKRFTPLDYSGILRAVDYAIERGVKVSAMELQAHANYKERQQREIVEQEKANEFINALQEALTTHQFQSGKDGNRAAFIPEDARNIIAALNNPDASSSIHEGAHMYERYIPKADKEAILSEIGKETWDTEVGEHFARGFEKFLASGKAKDPNMQRVYDNYAKWMIGIYGSVKGSEIDVPISPAMEKVYKQMLDSQGVNMYTKYSEEQIKASLTAAKTPTEKAKAELQSSWKEWVDTITSPGIIFDPRSSAERDVKLVKTVVKYLKASGIETIEEAARRLKEVFGFDLSSDDVSYLIDKKNTEDPVITPRALTRIPNSEVPFTMALDAYQAAIKNGETHLSALSVAKGVAERVARSTGLNDVEIEAVVRGTGTALAEKALRGRGASMVKKFIGSPIDRASGMTEGQVFKERLRALIDGANAAYAKYRGDANETAALVKESIAALSTALKDAGIDVTPQQSALLARSAAEAVRKATPLAAEEFVEIGSKILSDREYSAQIIRAKEHSVMLYNASKQPNIPANIRETFSALSKIVPSWYDTAQLREFNNKIEKTLNKIADKQGESFGAGLNDAEARQLFAKLYSEKRDAEINRYAAKNNLTYEQAREKLEDPMFSPGQTVEARKKRMLKYIKNNWDSLSGMHFDEYATFEDFLAAAGDNYAFIASAASSAKSQIETTQSEAQRLYIMTMGHVTGNEEIIDMVDSYHWEKTTAYEREGIRMAIENYVENGSYAGLQRYINQAKADNNAQKLAREYGNTMVRQIKSGTVSFNWARSVPQIFERIAGGRKSVVALGELSGHTEYVSGRVRAKQIGDAYDKGFNEVLKQNEEADNLVSENRIGVYAILEQGINGLPQHVTKKVYIEKMLETMVSQMEADGNDRTVKALKKIQEQVSESLDDMSDFTLTTAEANVYNYVKSKHAELYPEVKEFALRSKNEILNDEPNYSHKKVITTAWAIATRESRETGAEDLIDFTVAGARVDPSQVQSPATKKRNPTGLTIVDVAGGRTYDTRFYNVQRRSYHRTVEEVLTYDAVSVMAKFLASTPVRHSLGIENTRILQETISSEINNERIVFQYAYKHQPDFSYRAGIEILKGMKKAAYLRFLGAPAEQAIKQSMVVSRTAVKLGNDAIMLPFVYKDYFGEKGKHLQKLMEHSYVSRRDYQSVNILPKETLLEMYKQHANSKLRFEDWYDKVVFSGLRKSDKLQAQTAFIAYYAKYLKDAGLVGSYSDVNWEAHASNPNLKALTYAEQEVSRDQNVNDISQLPSYRVGTRTGGVGRITEVVVFDILAPLQQFSLNSKVNMINDVGMLFGNARTKEDRALAVRSLVAHSIESAAFNGAGIYGIDKLYQYVASSIYDNEEFDEGRMSLLENDFKLKKFVGRVVQDHIPMIQTEGISEVTDWLFNLGAFSIEELVDAGDVNDLTEKDFWKRYEQWQDLDRSLSYVYKTPNDASFTQKVAPFLGVYGRFSLDLHHAAVALSNLNDNGKYITNSGETVYLNEKDVESMRKILATRVIILFTGIQEIDRVNARAERMMSSTASKNEIEYYMRKYGVDSEFVNAYIEKMNEDVATKGLAGYNINPREQAEAIKRIVLGGYDELYERLETKQSAINKALYAQDVIQKVYEEEGAEAADKMYTKIHLYFAVAAPATLSEDFLLYSKSTGKYVSKLNSDELRRLIEKSTEDIKKGVLVKEK